MEGVIITGFRNPNKEGITLVFNKKFSMNCGLESKEWWVSWDKIGEALCGDGYCNASIKSELEKVRKQES